MTAQPALAVRDLEIGHGRDFALRIRALELLRGEVLAVLGPNGAGKTTLLRALAGLQAPRAGRIEGAAPGEIALVFQRPVLLRGSAHWNAQVALWPQRLARPERRRRARAALERFGIGALADRDAAALSGGEQRRLALARAFAAEPRVLLLDEPFDDLDAEGREALGLDLRRAIEETCVAAALVTHDLRQALLLSDRIAVLQGGALAQLGARDAVLRRPDTPAVAALVGMTNGFAGRIAARDGASLAWLELAQGPRLRALTPLAVGTPIWAGIRPEHVKIDVERSDPAHVGAGTVREIVSDGVLLTAWIDWDGLSLRAHLLAGRGLGHVLKPGDGVWIALRPEDVHVLAVPA